MGCLGCLLLCGWAQAGLVNGPIGLLSVSQWFCFTVNLASASKTLINSSVAGGYVVFTYLWLYATSCNCIYRLFGCTKEADVTKIVYKLKCFIFLKKTQVLYDQWIISRSTYDVCYQNSSIQSKKKRSKKNLWNHELFGFIAMTSYITMAMTGIRDFTWKLKLGKSRGGGERSTISCQFSRVSYRDCLECP